MMKFDAVLQEQQCGFVGKDGVALLVDEHRYGLDPFSLWLLSGGKAAVLFEGLRHIPKELLQLQSFGGAVVTLAQDRPQGMAVAATSLSKGGLPPEALAAAVILACASAGLLPPDEVHAVELDGFGEEIYHPGIKSGIAVFL